MVSTSAIVCDTEAVASNSNACVEVTSEVIGDRTGGDGDSA